MSHLEYKFTITPAEPFKEILIAYLEALPFESFIEDETGFFAYIKDNVPESEIKKIIANENFSEVEINYTTKEIENKNWNEEWEKDFQPIYVEDIIYIKANFHPENNDFPFVIHLQPKMAFGTGHHETTYLVLKAMLELDFEDKTVLDMGCGTAILAIFAKMKGAAYTEAIDIDEWAYDNSLENVAINNKEITVKKGDVSLIEGKKFDFVLANINKNILLKDIPKYALALNDGGTLVLSGLLHTDFEDIIAICKNSNLKFIKKERKNEWISIKLKK